MDETAKRRFRYNEEGIAEKAKIANKQRRYKQLLDEQVEEKRKRLEEQRKSQETEEKAWMIRPEEEPRVVGNSHSRAGRLLEDRDVQKVGHSRFLTEPPSQHLRSGSPSEDQEVSDYLQQCQKILKNLRDLTVVKPDFGGSKTPTSAMNKSHHRKFIRFEVGRKHGSTSLREMEQRYQKMYGVSTDKIHLPQLPFVNEIRKMQQRAKKQRMAVIINPTPITHNYQQPENRRSSVSRMTTEQPETKDATDMNNIKQTLKMLSVDSDRKIASQHSAIDQNRSIIDKINDQEPIDKHGSDKVIRQQPITSDQHIMSFDSRSQSHPYYNELDQRSKKSLLQLNKQRLKRLTNQPNPQDERSSKPNKNIMTHLRRVKAHGFKLFQKVNNYKQNIMPHNEYMVSNQEY